MFDLLCISWLIEFSSRTFFCIILFLVMIDCFFNLNPPLAFFLSSTHTHCLFFFPSLSLFLSPPLALDLSHHSTFWNYKYYTIFTSFSLLLISFNFFQFHFFYYYYSFLFYQSTTNIYNIWRLLIDTFKQQWLHLLHILVRLPNLQPNSIMVELQRHFLG